MVSSTDIPKAILNTKIVEGLIGIPANPQRHVFEAFEQVDGSTSRTRIGTGLGLHISEKFANAMGFRILVASREGQGSTFTIDLAALR